MFDNVRPSVCLFIWDTVCFHSGGLTSMSSCFIFGQPRTAVDPFIFLFFFFVEMQLPQILHQKENGIL